MYFEVYLDSLFILQFIMNMFLLSLVDCMMKQGVSVKRLLCGALCAALSSVLILLLPIKMIFKMPVGILLPVLGMGMVTFRIKTWTSFLRFLEKLSIGTLLLGGMSLMILKRFTKDTRIIFNLTMVLMAGGCAFFVLKKIIQKHGQQSRNCKVTLYGKEMLEVNALLDTGNSLQEPISGKAVAILDKKVFEKVFPDKQQEGFRAIPYHSIGKKHGILPGYLLEHIRVETEDGFKECREIYVGISEEIMSENNDYKMILNPRILERKG